MRLTAAACLVSILLVFAPLPDTTVSGQGTFMPVDALKAGMRGTGITVFEGTSRVEFGVEILGVLENVIGPRRNLILARLSGHRLDETGVMQGMSGSPVYIDGRLVGAVSYSLGAFSKEPIAGITPIAEMIDATTTGAPRPAAARPAPAALRWPQSKDEFVAALQDALARVRPAGAAAGLGGLHLNGSSGLPAGAMLQPLAAPFTLAGFSGDTQQAFHQVLSGLGVAAVAPPAGRAPEVSSSPLAPGDAVGVSLINGDLTFGATGTVTHVDGDRVYAFGHPFFNLGPTEFPMTRAWVQTLLPSLYVSAKLAAIGDTIGTVRQDRATAISGVLGRGPAMVPVSLALASERGPTRTFRFNIAKDQLFTPLLTFAAIVNTLQSYERQFGSATFALRGKAVVRDYGSVSLEDIFTGDTPAIGAAAYVAGPLTLLLRNDRQPVQIEAVDLTIQSFEEPRFETVERVWLGTREPRPGQTVKVNVLTRSYRGEERTHTLAMPIPVTARGTVTIVVSDGSRLAQIEQREHRQPRDVDTVAQLIRTFNRARKNNRLYVKLTAPASGAVVRGEQLPALPPSVLAVVEGEQAGANVLPLSTTVLGEWELPSDQAVIGQRSLAVSLREP